MISVCMATYNGEKFIKQQIDSILCQLEKNDELIISDDGSTDNTLKIINSYNDVRIKMFHHKKNKKIQKLKWSKNFYYATENFENALKQAKGDYIFLSDQDDIWKADKVQKMLEKLKLYDMVMSNFSLIDENSNILIEKFYEKSPISNKLIKNIIESHFLGCCMGFNKKVLNYVLPFPRKLIGHDYWIGCLGVHKFKFCFINEPLHLYRRMNNNVSTATGKSSNPIIYRIFYRCVFLLKVKTKLCSR